MKILSLMVIFLIINPNDAAIIYNFKKEKSVANWNIVDDGVMGGLSRGSISLTNEGNAIYQGYVTTENNGGFSSVRYSFNKKNVTQYSHIMLKVKGDGKTYQFRIKENSYQRYSYINYFDTSGTWETIRLPLKDFYPSYRGYKLNRPNFNGKHIEEVTFLIGNKVKEKFALEIESISLE